MKWLISFEPAKALKIGPQFIKQVLFVPTCPFGANKCQPTICKFCNLENVNSHDLVC